MREVISLEELVLPFSFNDELTEILPPNLRRLFLSCSRAIISDNTLPHTLTSLIFTTTEYSLVIKSLPSSILHVQFPQNYPHAIPPLSPNLIHLGLPFLVKEFPLPNTLKFLRASFFPSAEACPQLDDFWFINNTPLDPNFSRILLTRLTLDDGFNQTVNNLLPTSLRYLRLGDSFDQNIDQLPGNLKVLILGFCFNQRIATLPGALCELYFGVRFDSEIVQYPTELKILEYGETYFRLENIPVGLMYLTFPRFNEVSTANKARYLARLPWLIRLRYVIERRYYEYQLHS